MYPFVESGWREFNEMKTEVVCCFQKSALKSADLTGRHAFYTSLLPPALKVDLMIGNPEVTYD